MCIGIKPKLPTDVGQTRELVLGIGSVAGVTALSSSVTSTIRRPDMSPGQLKGNETILEKASEF